MLSSTKIELVYRGLKLAAINSVTTLAVTFLKKSLYVSRAASNDTHLAVLLESTSLIHCMVGKIQQACTYEGIKPSIQSTKLNTFLKETAEWPEKYPPQKKTLEESCTQLINGKKNIVEFMKQQPAEQSHIEQYQNSLQIYKQMTEQKKDLPKKRGHIIIAPPNTGKTTAAVRILLKNRPYYIKALKTLTFDQYCGEPAILIDDLQKNSPLLPLLRKLCDVFPVRINTRRRYANVQFETVVVTTQYSLQELTQDIDLREALMDRFTFYTMGESFTLKEI